MRIKKSYIAPESTAYSLPSGALCQTINVSGGNKVDNPGDIGYSQKFWGGVEDDTEESFPWEEEK